MCLESLLGLDIKQEVADCGVFFQKCSRWGSDEMVRKSDVFGVNSILISSITCLCPG